MSKPRLLTTRQTAAEMRTLSQHVRLWMENLIMTSLMPLHGPGRVMRWVFKIPLLLYRIGLGRWVPTNVLILTTVGRKSGKLRKTPLGYAYDAATNTYQVMAGWAGKTDWYKNARANPNVLVQAGAREFQAVAELMPEEQVTQMMLEVTRLNPGSLAMWSRWAQRPLDASEASLRQAAPYFPSLLLRPLDGRNQAAEEAIAQTHNP